MPEGGLLAGFRGVHRAETLDEAGESHRPSARREGTSLRSLLFARSDVRPHPAACAQRLGTGANGARVQGEALVQTDRSGGGSRSARSCVAGRSRSAKAVALAEVAGGI